MITIGPAITIHPIGALIAVAIVISVILTLWWMLHPPISKVQVIARDAESELERMVGSIIVVFSEHIQSQHMMALAAKLAKGERSELLAIYVVSVPYSLPPDAEMTDEERNALDALGAAQAIASKADINLRTETVKARSTKQAVLDIAKRERANLIVLGSFREGKYTGAPLSRTIEEIAAEAKCDVLIGVEGKHGNLLVDQLD
ncbi:MAG TPA: universal stress protein [Candidatus Dormibacteraeota bacterium]|nr:universal stress protein [Candidatus Dormibacteraeota bacterium]